MQKLNELIGKAIPIASIKQPNAVEAAPPPPVQKPKVLISAKIKKLVEVDKRNLYIYIPILSAYIIFKNGKRCKFYSYEMRTSISQIRFRDFHPAIDFDFGYQALISMIEDKLKGQYKSAIIYITVSRKSCERDSKPMRIKTNILDGVYT